MQDQIDQLKIQVQQLQEQLSVLELAQNSSFKGLLDDRLVERVMNTDTSGTPTTNDLLREITIGMSTVTILDYPTRIMIYNWKGQRLAIPVYDADNIIYP